MQQRKGIVGVKKLKGTQPAASQDLPQAFNLHKQSSVASHSRERQGSVNNPQGGNPGKVQIHLEGHLERGYNLNPPAHKFSLTTQGTSTKNNEPKKFKFGVQKEPQRQQQHQPPLAKGPPGIVASGQRFYSQDEMNPQSFQMMSVKNQSINSIDENFAHDIQFQSQLTTKAAAKPEEPKPIQKKKKIVTVRSGKSSQAESRGQQMQKLKLAEAMLPQSTQHPQQPASAKLRKPSIQASKRKMKNIQPAHQSGLNFQNPVLPRHLQEGIMYDPGRGGIQTTTNAKNQMYDFTPGATVPDLYEESAPGMVLNQTYNFPSNMFDTSGINSGPFRKPGQAFLAPSELMQQVDRTNNTTNLQDDQKRASGKQALKQGQNWNQIKAQVKPNNISTKTLLVSNTYQTQTAQTVKGAQNAENAFSSGVVKAIRKPQAPPKKKNSQQVHPQTMQQIAHQYQSQQAAFNASQQRKGNSPADQIGPGQKQGKVPTRNPNFAQQMGSQNLRSLGGPNMSQMEEDRLTQKTPQNVMASQGKHNDPRLHDFGPFHNGKKAHFPTHGPASVKNQRAKRIDFETYSNGGQENNAVFSQTGPIPKEVLQREDPSQQIINYRMQPSSEMTKKMSEKDNLKFPRTIGGGKGTNAVAGFKKTNQSPMQKSTKFGLMTVNSSANPSKIHAKSTVGPRIMGSKPSSLQKGFHPTNKPQSPTREGQQVFGNRPGQIFPDTQFSMPSQPSLPRKTVQYGQQQHLQMPQQDEQYQRGQPSYLSNNGEDSAQHHQQSINQPQIQLIYSTEINAKWTQPCDDPNQQANVPIKNLPIQNQLQGDFNQISSLIIQQQSKKDRDGEGIPQGHQQPSSAHTTKSTGMSNQQPHTPNKHTQGTKINHHLHANFPKTDQQTPKNNPEAFKQNIDMILKQFEPLIKTKQSQMASQQAEDAKPKRMPSETKRQQQFASQPQHQRQDENTHQWKKNSIGNQEHAAAALNKFRSLPPQGGTLQSPQGTDEEIVRQNISQLKPSQQSRQGAGIFFSQPAQKSFDDPHIQSVDSQSNNLANTKPVQNRPSSHKRKVKVAPQRQAAVQNKQVIKRGRGSSAGSKEGKPRSSGQNQSGKAMNNTNLKVLMIDPNFDIPVKVQKPVTVTYKNGITVGGQDIFSFQNGVNQNTSPKQISTPFATGKKKDDQTATGGGNLVPGNAVSFTLKRFNDSMKQQQHKQAQQHPPQRQQQRKPSVIENLGQAQKSPKSSQGTMISPMRKPKTSPAQKSQPQNVPLRIETTNPIAQHPDMFGPSSTKYQGNYQQVQSAHNGPQQTNSIPLVKRQTPKQKQPLQLTQKMGDVSSDGIILQHYGSAQQNQIRQQAQQQYQLLQQQAAAHHQPQMQPQHQQLQQHPLPQHQQKQVQHQQQPKSQQPEPVTQHQSNSSSDHQTQTSQSYTALAPSGQPLQSYDTTNQNSGMLEDTSNVGQVSGDNGIYNQQIEIIEYNSSRGRAGNISENAPSVHLDNNNQVPQQAQIQQQIPHSRQPQQQQLAQQPQSAAQLQLANLQQSSSNPFIVANDSTSRSQLTPAQSSSHPQALPPTNQDGSSDSFHLPQSGARVLRHYLNRPELTEYEKSEILDFRVCFYLGLQAQKIRGSRQSQFNYGYDDQRGDYKVVLNDHIGYRYQVLDFLGQGSFGQALKCRDHKNGEIVALKIIRNKRRLQHQAGVELNILLHLKDNDPEDTNNIIRIKDYCEFRKHLVISFELFSINLYEFIRSNNFEGVSLNLIRRFAIQILQALKYLREENLIHCDLKPENILLKSPDKSGIKVIDFGSSCFANQIIYTYIQSRFYRAPEIILGIEGYTGAIDMWSFGCILAELYIGVPLFPGESEQEQLTLIMECMGLPRQDLLERGLRTSKYFDPATQEPYLTRDSNDDLRVPGRKPLEEVLMCDSPSFLDFIKRCLTWNPEERITPFEALMHDWIIEGLPPQVLIHHRRMLGINDSELDTMVDDVGGEEFQVQTQQDNSQTINELSDVGNIHQIDSNDLSNSQIQIVNESIERDSLLMEEHQLDQIQQMPQSQQIQSQPQIAQSMAQSQHQQLHQHQQQAHPQMSRDNVYHGSQYLNEMPPNQIDFYGQQQQENLQLQSHQFIEAGDPSELEVNHVEVELLQEAFEEAPLLQKDGWMPHSKGAPTVPMGNRDGARQNNFDKTGKNFFSHEEEKDEPRVQRMFVANVKASKSEMGHEEEQEAAAQQQMCANLNFPMMSNGAHQYQKKHLNLLEINQSIDKHKTTNISEILSQINKKSKSTKHTTAQQMSEFVPQQTAEEHHKKYNPGAFLNWRGRDKDAGGHH